ncbi:response regulator [Maricaulis sp. CAU 1757]
MKIFLAEDEVLIALDLSMALEAMNHFVVGPAHDIETARSMAREEDIDFAVLDLNLSGELSFPIAQILEQRKIPYTFLTGYQLSHLPREYQHAQLLQKPVSMPELNSLLLRAQAGRVS